MVYILCHKFYVINDLMREPRTESIGFYGLIYSVPGSLNSDFICKI